MKATMKYFCMVLSWAVLTYPKKFKKMQQENSFYFLNVKVNIWITEVSYNMYHAKNLQISTSVHLWKKAFLLGYK